MSLVSTDLPDGDLLKNSIVAESHELISAFLDISDAEARRKVIALARALSSKTAIEAQPCS